MILSNVAIQKAIKTGRLIIDPQPLPLRPSEREPDCPYQTSAVDLRLGNEISWFRPGLPITMNLIHGGFQTLFKDAAETKPLADGEAFELRPHMLVLAKTKEWIELPILNDSRKPCLAARIEGRSSYARCGLLVHFTAPTIHSGYAGPITLEISNFGQYPIALRANHPICQLIVEEVKGVPFQNVSQFHHAPRSKSRARKKAARRR